MDQIQLGVGVFWEFMKLQQLNTELLSIQVYKWKILDLKEGI